MKIDKDFLNIFILSLTFFVALIIYFNFNSYINNNKNTCIIGNDCFNVWQSKYGKFLNINLSIWGILFSLFLLILNILKLVFRKDFNFLKYFYFLGFLISLYLIFLQFFVIKKICFYCLIYDFLIISLFLLNLSWQKIIYFFSKIIKVSK